MMNTLAIISWTNPALLWGLAAVALPILVHLVRRRARRRVLFPTVELLREASAGVTRMLKVRRWLLMLLRCSIVVLLVWAFARPVWSLRGEPPGRGSATVLVLDVSASMSRQTEGVTAFERMKSLVLRRIDEMESGSDVAGIVLAARTPRAMFNEPIANLGALRDEVSGISPTVESSDLSAAIQIANEMLREFDGEARVVVFSDMQASSWAGVIPSVTELDGVVLEIVPVARTPGTSFQLARARVEPSMPLVGRIARISAEVTNHSEVAQRIVVAASLNDGFFGEQAVELKAGETGVVAFEWTPGVAGWQRVVLSTSGDGLSIDDNHSFAFEVEEQRRVVLVSSLAPEDSMLGGYFVRRALAPFVDERDSYRVEWATPDRIDDAVLDGADGVVLCEFNSLPERAGQAIVAYVERGGGVLVFAGNETGIEGLFTSDSTARTDAVRRLDPDSGLSGALRSFNDPNRESLREITFTRSNAFAAVAGESETLLRFDDGTPALVAIRKGRGVVVAANFSPAPAWSDLAKHGAFVALMHDWMELLTPLPDPVAATSPGEYFASESTDAGSDIEIIGPDGRDYASMPVGPPGFYAVSRDGELAGIHAVNVDERESDPRLLEEVPNPSAGDSVERGGFVQQRNERQLWGWCLMGVSLAMALELLVMNRWKS